MGCCVSKNQTESKVSAPELANPAQSVGYTADPTSDAHMVREKLQCMYILCLLFFREQMWFWCMHSALSLMQADTLSLCLLTLKGAFVLLATVTYLPCHYHIFYNSPLPPSPYLSGTF